MPKSAYTPYTGAAGGLDALISSLKALREQQIVVAGSKTLLRANQPEGFDCPGCAWPDRNHHSSFEFCENGVKAVAAESTRKRVTAAFFARHSVEDLLSWEPMALEGAGRLTQPMLLEAGASHYLPVDWDTAFGMIGETLRGLAHPDQALFYTSGRTSNEAAFLYQWFVREFGTNNLPDCSNMCHEPSGVALGQTIGSGKGSVVLEDFEHAEAIFIFGQNPGTNHPRMLGELRDAARRGARVVVFNPLRERGLERFSHPQHALELLGRSTPLATHYYTLKIGGDLAALAGICKHLIDIGAVDAEFIRSHTEGYAELRTHLQALTWAEIQAQSGLRRDELVEAAEVYAASKATICCWGMGLTQHRRAVATLQMLVNLLLLGGNLGKRGAGACPVRGHSNVQGDRTMGINERPSAEFLDRLQAMAGFDPPRAHGADVIAAIEAMERGDARVFIAMGGNFAAATPDRERTEAALRRCDLTVQISTKLNRSHLVHGRRALILPCLGRTEVDLQAGGPQSVTVEDSMSMVHLSCGMNTPASTWLKSEPAIVAGMARATLPHSATRWDWLVADYDRIRDCIAQVVEGFADFNRRVAVAGGFHLEHPVRQRQWRTSSGKARFTVQPLAPSGAPQFTSSDVLTLMTVRSHDQYNTTIYGLDDRYRGIRGERRPCFISEADLQRLGLRAGQRVDLVSADGERRAEDFLLVAYAIPSGNLASYFPETNSLIALADHAEVARTPASKAIAVRIEARAAG